MGDSFGAAPNANGGKGSYRVLLLAVLLVAGAAAVAYYKSHGASKGLSVQDLRVERVTRNGKAATVALSPDGQSVAYVMRGGTTQSVVLHEIATGKETQLVEPEPVSYAGLTFSPDGNSLYYTASSKDNQLYSFLHKIPVHGGQPERLIEDIDTAVSFSPDGKRIAFVRGVPDKRENDLIVANADGSDLKVIVKRPGQVYAASLIAPAWSPDGSTIIFSNYQGTNRRYLMAVAPDGSGLREFYKSHSDLGRPQWLPDGSALLVPMREGAPAERVQIWKVDFPSANASKLTNDPRDYSMLWLNVDRTAKSLASVETIITGDLSILPGGDTADEKQVDTGGALLVYVSSFGKDKILYETRDGRVFTADTDGANSKQVAMAEPGIREVSACGDGKHIVFAKSTGETEDIWRVDADGTNPVQLTKENSSSGPTCAPDGRSVIYWNDEEHNLFRVPIGGGSSAKANLPNASSPYLRFSPDGKFVIYNSENQDEAKKMYGVVIAPANGGAATMTFPMVPGMGMAPPQWSPDGHGLYVNLMRQGAANIWKMDSPGGAMKQVTNFPSGLIASYAWSPDGKTLYVARGTRSTDVILLRAAR
jgi:TolB protein